MLLLGEMYFGAQKKKRQKKYFTRAKALTGSRIEQSLLQKKITECNQQQTFLAPASSAAQLSLCHPLVQQIAIQQFRAEI